MASDDDAPRPTATTSHADEPLHPDDAAWIARRASVVAPLVLGILSVVLGPILLGLFFGPLGLRAGLELRRQGVRGPGAVAAIATSALGIVISVTAALLWGAVLSGVLLGRDAMRTAESWRGEVVREAMVAALVDGRPAQIDLARPRDGAPRHAILVIGVGWEPCASAIRSLSEVAAAHPEVPVVVLDRTAEARDVEAFARVHGTDAASRFIFVGPLAALPTPLEQAAAIPTLIIVGPDGAIEQAVVGAHPTADIEKLLRGDAALPPAGSQPAGVR